MMQEHDLDIEARRLLKEALQAGTRAQAVLSLINQSRALRAEAEDLRQQATALATDDGSVPAHEIADERTALANAIGRLLVRQFGLNDAGIARLSESTSAILAHKLRHGVQLDSAQIRAALLEAIDKFLSDRAA
ncbi:MAG TPA: hypothetical protein VIL01_03495 [Thermomicrobiales bacterium]